MCPFVERVRLALAAKKLALQSVQMNLADRAKWHREVSNGFVPILEIKGKLLTESVSIIEYIDKLPGYRMVA